ncbi:MAG: DUF1425 domain-containing protein [Phycisphaerae bacterium]|nr:DUF1425 domain-containing protein [Phycisphaerae bacterium]
MKSVLSSDWMRLALLSLLVLLCGCKATNTVSSRHPGVRPNAIDVSYKVDNAFLALELKVISAYEEVVNGLINAQINVRNEGAGELRYMWQVVWFNKSGMQVPIEPVTWTREFLAERQDGTILFTAPTRDAVDWRVTLRKWERKE